jgi:hypothetical protein
MTMVHVLPTEVSVACDPFSGRPLAVRLGSEQLRVVAIERVRDESAAYRVEHGPRTLFVVRTQFSRLQLAFQHRSRRWLVDGVDMRPEPLPSVARWKPVTSNGTAARLAAPGVSGGAA